MAQTKSDRTQLINSLGIKDLTRDGYLVLADEHGNTIGYANMLKINSHSLSNLSFCEINSILSKFRSLINRFLNAYIEIVSIPYNTDNHQQKAFWNSKLEHDLHESQDDNLTSQQKEFINTKMSLINNAINRFKQVSNSIKHQNRSFIMLVFDKDITNLQVDTKSLCNDKIITTFPTISPLSLSKKIHILKSIEYPNKFNSKSYKKFINSTDIKHQLTDVLDDYKKPAIHTLYMHNSCYYSFLDFNFLTYKDDSDIPAFWLVPIMNKSYTISSLSIGHLDSMSSKHNMSMALISPKSKSYVYMSLHIIVFANSSKQLLSRVDTIKSKSNAHYVHIVNRQPQKDNLKSIFQPISLQRKSQNNYVKLILPRYLYRGYMANKDQLLDSHGSYFGRTLTNGEFCFNPYQLNVSPNLIDYRTRNMSLIAGDSGMGKTTLAKMLCNDSLARNNHVFNVDFTGEYRHYTKQHHGLVVDPSLADNHINMFQLFTTMTDSNGQPDISGSYINNTIRIANIYKYLNPNLTDGDISYLFECLDKFYASKKLFDAQVTNLKASAFPTIADFAHYLSNIYKKCRHNRENTIAIKKLIDATGYIYDIVPFCNLHTCIKDLSRHPLVDIDISLCTPPVNTLTVQQIRRNTLNGKSTFKSVNPLDEHVAVALNYISYFMDISIKHNVHVKNHKDEPYYNYLNLDEAGWYFSRHHTETITLLYNYMLEMRKDHSAITLCIPDIEHIVPKTSENSTYAIDARKILGLIQYFHLFRMSDEDIYALKSWFKRALINSASLLATVNLNPHEVMTIIIGNRSFEWMVKK